MINVIIINFIITIFFSGVGASQKSSEHFGGLRNTITNDNTSKRTYVLYLEITYQTKTSFFKGSVLMIYGRIRVFKIN